jgi:NAD(P)-dependent dehydrogenase (short-subunit alcohol dehydrogenase family)
MSKLLAGQKALVIGGSSGLGFHIAAGFAREGAEVTIAARTVSKVEEATVELRAIDPRSNGVSVDVANRKEFDAFLAECGTPDLLVNAQGIQRLRPAEEFTSELYDEIMEVNIRSVFFACTVIGKRMLERGSGSIINIASMAAHLGFTRAAVYTTSKHGVAGLTKTLAAEWGVRGVRVNAISPGYFMTPLAESNMSPLRKQQALDRTPMDRFGRLEEIASAALFLASPQSTFINGTIVNVDGGYLHAGIK